MLRERRSKVAPREVGNVKYMLLLCDADATAYENMPKAEMDKAYARIGQWWGEKQQKGVIAEGAQLQGPDKATTVKAKNRAKDRPANAAVF